MDTKDLLRVIEALVDDTEELQDTVLVQAFFIEDLQRRVSALERANRED